MDERTCELCGDNKDYNPCECYTNKGIVRQLNWIAQLLEQFLEDKRLHN